MKLIGMLDSPYVRRVAISLLRLGLPFEHANLSVFRNFDAFSAINPAVKAPTLVCDDGTVLMDSTLILQYAEALAAPRTLVPAGLAAQALELHRIGLALAACEKSVQMIYERSLRPPEKRHQPWVDRVTGQLAAACAGLEASLTAQPAPVTSETLTQGTLTAAVAWHFVQQTVPDAAPAAAHPTLVALGAAAEALPAFRAAPYGDGTVQPL